MHKKPWNLGFGFLTAFLMIWGAGCSVNFNMTGTKQKDNLETISIQQFSNEAPLVVASLAQDFTQKLQDQFISRSRLSLTPGAADVVITGSISNYTISPTAISGNEVAAQNRLTISVRVNYENNVEARDSWEQTFSAFSDFNSSSDFASIEQTLIEEVTDQLTQNIFNESLGKW